TRASFCLRFAHGQALRAWERCRSNNSNSSSRSGGRICARTSARWWPGWRNPAGYFAALHFDLVRPISIILLGGGIAKIGQLLLGLSGAREIARAGTAHADCHPANCLRPWFGIANRLQLARIAPLG